MHGALDPEARWFPFHCFRLGSSLTHVYINFARKCFGISESRVRTPALVSAPSLFQVDSWSRQVDFSEQVKVFYIIQFLSWGLMIYSNPQDSWTESAPRGTA